ncbi:hypothetical protein [Natronospira bacteriovora]|uniref:Porin n=1 Tax=Natronospira bacteriovora TaxID=3069753 RepID=A0ABU0W4N3_9GAMM|nr:hypothetical protein [Natronospira sp. AB-CW4]MDQ2068909.1 hypothetical protein [Natronospira sp. AB-CW4]
MRPYRRPTSRAAPALLALLVLPVIGLTQELPAQWEPLGDLRGGYYASESRDTGGERSDSDAWRARLRAGFQGPLAPNWAFRLRAAGSYSSEVSGGDVYLRGRAPTRSGIATGDTTVDELQLRWSAPGSEWGMIVGRFQMSAGIPIVPGKALDRKDSSNLGVSWTDGVELRYPLAGEWRGRSRLFHNHRKGSGSVSRAPLDYTASGSRAGLNSLMERPGGPGPISLQRVTLTWLPDALPPAGNDNGARRDYRSLTASLAANWPVGIRGTRLVLAGEVGYAEGRPDAAHFEAGAPGKAGGQAWQASINLFDVLPGHHIGLVHGLAEQGWLHSVDYQNNQRLSEIRYQRRFSQALSMEARYRLRSPLDYEHETQRPRLEDIYLRLTARF